LRELRELGGPILAVRISLNVPRAVLDGYCSIVQGLLDWFEVDLGFPELVL